MQNNVITIFMETHSDKEILDLINAIDFKQAVWTEEMMDTHVFDFGSLTIKIKTYAHHETVSIVAIGDVPCHVDFESYMDFATKLNECKASMRDKAVNALIELKNTQKPVDTASARRTEDKIKELEKAMRVDLHTEEGAYLGDDNCYIPKRDENKKEKFLKASEIASDYFIRIRGEVIAPLDYTFESRRLFGKCERFSFAALFVLYNKMNFNNYAEAQEKAEEMYNFVHRTDAN